MNARASKWFTLVFALAWCAGSALPRSAAQSGTVDDEYGYGEPVREDVPEAGIWPTPLMIDRAIDRMTEDLAERYGFDEDQLYQTRELVKERLPVWMNENRGAIQRAVNEFIEVQLGVDAPTPEMVADWAQRVSPLLDGFKSQVIGITDDMRDFMTDDQIVMLDGEMAAFQTGISMTQNKLQGWADGGYDPETEWFRDRRERHQADVAEQRDLEAKMEEARREAERQSAEAKGMSPPNGGAVAGGAVAQSPGGKPVAVKEQKSPTDEWDAYVEAFKRRYNLRAEQCAKADTLLKSQKQGRDQYLARNAEKMRRITDLFRDPEKLEQAKKEYKKLNEPIDRRFKILKERLDKLPDSEQRRQAARAAREAAAEPADGAERAERTP